jgi:PAS domain S-box-containing protein
MKVSLRVLLVEDSESDADLIVRQLKKAEYSVHHERIENAQEMKKALEKQMWDIVISDYKLPRFNAAAALTLLQKAKIDIPFVIVSGSMEEELAVELMKAGAHDYLTKNKLVRLAQVVKRELAEAQMRRERKQSEEELRESEERYRCLVEVSPDTVAVHANGKIVYINPAGIKLLRAHDRSELIDKPVLDIVHPDYKELVRQRVMGAIEQGKAQPMTEEKFLCLDGTVIDVEVVSVPTIFKGMKAVQVVARNITDRKLVVEVLRHSEEMFRGVISAVPVGIGIVSNREVQWVNDSLLHLIGRQKEEIIKKNARIFYSSDEMYDQVGKQFYDDLREKGRAHIEVDWQHKDGSILNIYLTGGAVDQQAISRGIVFAALDITERKRAEVELKESEERYRRLVEFSPDAIVVHSEGKIRYVNPAALTLLGATKASELIGKPFLDIIHSDYRDSVHQQIITLMKEDTALPLTEQKFIRLDDGSIVDVEVAAMPIVYKEKSAMQLVVRDISEQKKLQGQLLQTQKIQSIGTLAGGIAHDFNNILGIILAYSSLLDKSKLTPDKFSVSIIAINQAVQRGAALVRQILTFARKTDILFEPTDIPELIHELLSMLGQTFPKTITFSESIEKSLPFILADRTQIHQALLNLCINSRDAMPQGGSISISAGKQTKEQIYQKFPDAREKEYVCLTVTDTGKGMDEATRQRVYDPFFTTKEKGKGTGLGLSVVYGIVQAHHGFIDVKSDMGRGTTFRLFFPVPVISEQTAVPQQSVESYEIGGTETIMFVEDEELLLQMVSFLLESKGYKVLCARDGLEAVNIFLSHKQEIALVITDMGLPVMTGTDEFKKLREIDPNVKVIFASGFFEPDIKSELQKDGDNGFIQKPYDPNDILRMIRQVLDKKA